MAVGSDTSQMASCFPCTTYMYAAGFPPSSVHLGRGESWLPLPENQGEPYDDIARSLNARWHADCWHYLEQGWYLLDKFAKGHARRDSLYVDDAHREALDALITTNMQRPLSKGGNLLLDALTVHDSEWKRIKRTLHTETLAANNPYT